MKYWFFLCKGIIYKFQRKIKNWEKIFSTHMENVSLVSPSQVSGTACLSLSLSQTTDFKANERGGGLPLIPNKVT